MIAQGRRVITEAMVAEIEALAPRYPNRRALVLPALHIVNRELLHVPLDAVVDIAAVLGLPAFPADGHLTIEPAECLGACDFAPCILANDDLLKNMTPEAAEAELKKPRGKAT